MKNLTTKLPLAAALTLVLSTFGAPAAQAADAAPEHAVSFNVMVASDYRFRGVSQTRLEPALQGGADYTHSPTGLYAGVWASTIKWTGDLGAKGDVEVDLYGGKRGEIVSGITYDVGGLYYAYPSYNLEPDADTFEVYGQIGYGPTYLKYSRSTTNLFGTANSKGSGYLDLTSNVDIGNGVTVNIHAGRQMVKNWGELSYNDYKVGITKDLGFAALSVAVVGVSIDVITPRNDKNIARSGAVVMLTKTF